MKSIFSYITSNKGHFYDDKHKEILYVFLRPSSQAL